MAIPSYQSSIIQKKSGVNDLIVASHPHGTDIIEVGGGPDNRFSKDQLIQANSPRIVNIDYCGTEKAREDNDFSGTPKKGARRFLAKKGEIQNIQARHAHGDIVVQANIAELENGLRDSQVQSVVGRSGTVICSFIFSLLGKLSVRQVTRSALQILESDGSLFFMDYPAWGYGAGFGESSLEEAAYLKKQVGKVREQFQAFEDETTTSGLAQRSFDLVPICRRDIWQTINGKKNKIHENIARDRIQVAFDEAKNSKQQDAQADGNHSVILNFCRIRCTQVLNGGNFEDKENATRLFNELMSRKQMVILSHSEEIRKIRREDRQKKRRNRK